MPAMLPPDCIPMVTTCETMVGAIASVECQETPAQPAAGYPYFSIMPGRDKYGNPHTAWCAKPQPIPPEFVKELLNRD